jgi:hypothetical protein
LPLPRLFASDVAVAIDTARVASSAASSHMLSLKRMPAKQPVAEIQNIAMKHVACGINISIDVVSRIGLVEVTVLAYVTPSPDSNFKKPQK